MKSLFTLFFLLFTTINPNVSGQKEKCFKNGEWFKFRIHYGIFNASYATLKLEEKTLDGKKVFHAKGIGKSTGLLDLFFKVEDYYESYFDAETGKPYKFVRKINEGGHTKDIEIDFNHSSKKAHVNDKKRNNKTDHVIKPNTQDMMSAYYYLRNNVDTSTLKVGDEFKINMFFDKENYDFKLKFLGYETLKTKFGKIKCLKFRPYVQSGRVFKEEESLTVWISNDKNKIPVRLQADLAVGSLKADLDAYSSLKHQFKIEM